MPYELLLTDQAEIDLSNLPAHLLNVVEQQLDLLAEHPATLSRPVVSPPYPPGAQMYLFRHKDTDEGAHSFVVLFHYRTDETTLVITGIGHTEYWNPSQG